MEDNNTFIRPKVVTDSDEELVSDESGELAMKILFYCVTPTICALGLTGNLLSMKILYIHGLNRCSNVLLFSLAIFDTGYLIGANNIPNVIYVLNGNFPYSKSLSHFLYVVYLIFLVFDYGVGLSALTIPMLITSERFVAVYFPLKFSRIVTPRRVWFLVGCVLTYWLTYIMYSCFWFEFQYKFDENLNRSVGIMARSQLFYDDLPKIKVLNEIYFSMKIPPAFTLVGCILIIVKLRYVARKRRVMTNAPTDKDKVNMKTTQMLLVLCFVYIFACMAVALPTYLPEEWIAYSLTSETSTNLGRIMYQLMNIIICVNSSWNFFIYVGLNKNFRDIFKDLVSNCCRTKGKN